MVSNLPHVSVGSPHAVSHNAERDAINGVNELAASAKNIADSANSLAATASNTAASAVNTATTATNTANAADTKATNASAAAAAADTKATNAASAAAAADTKATNAGNAASAADTKATNAASAAALADTKATNAGTAAATADTKATNAAAAAATADAKAVAADTKATNAASAAATAQSTANTANTTANNAASAAATADAKAVAADTKAQNAANAANTAQLTANSVNNNLIASDTRFANFKAAIPVEARNLILNSGLRINLFGFNQESNAAIARVSNSSALSGQAFTVTKTSNTTGNKSITAQVAGLVPNAFYTLRFKSSHINGTIGRVVQVTTSNSVTTPASSVQTVSPETTTTITFQNPSNNSGAVLYFYNATSVGGDAATGTAHIVYDLSMTEGTIAPIQWFDGESPGCEWEGDPHSSTSVRKFVNKTVFEAVSRLNRSMLVGSGVPYDPAGSYVLEAEPGAIYVDKAKTRGAFKWELDTDGVWRCIKGDTGWINLTNTANFGNAVFGVDHDPALLLVRRVNDKMIISINPEFGNLGSNPASDSLPECLSGRQLPTAFYESLPIIRYKPFTLVNDDSQPFTIQTYTPYNGAFGNFQTISGIDPADATLAATFEYTTTLPWPSTLTF